MEPASRVKGVQAWLYVIIVESLALYLVIGVVVWSWLILAGVATPGSFTTILAAIAGALAGIAAPRRARGVTDFLAWPGSRAPPWRPCDPAGSRRRRAHRPPAPLVQEIVSFGVRMPHGLGAQPCRLDGEREATSGGLGRDHAEHSC